MRVDKEIREAIKTFVRNSPLNRMPDPGSGVFFDEPLVQFAAGNDPIFAEYKNIIHPTHLTPAEALARAFDKSPADMPPGLSVISWILPITAVTRESNRGQAKIPSRLWSYTRTYGEKFNDTLRQYVIDILTGKGYMAAAPMLQPYFNVEYGDNDIFSNWSERHMAYAAGLGTFSLSDGFITERGIAQRCGSVVTDLELPASPRTSASHLSNCLFYANGKCNSCVGRCPGGAISEKGHDKQKCREYMRVATAPLKIEYGTEVPGCGLCQTKVPCEFQNPTRKLSNKAA